MILYEVRPIELTIEYNCKMIGMIRLEIILKINNLFKDIRFGYNYKC